MFQTKEQKKEKRKNTLCFKQKKKTQYQSNVPCRPRWEPVPSQGAAMFSDSGAQVVVGCLGLSWIQGRTLAAALVSVQAA
jgi:hypothetical protein